MVRQNKQAGKLWHVISGLSLITSKQIKNKCFALKWRERLGQSVLSWCLIGETFDLEQNLHEPSNRRSTVSPPLSASVKLMLWEGIAATEGAKEILLPELHRWWGENKSFWGRQKESFRNPHKPDEPGTAWIYAPCIFMWWKGERMNERPSLPRQCIALEVM